MITFFQKFWLYLKKYWQPVLLAIAGIMGFFLFRRNTQNWTDRIKELQDQHDTELKKIDDARAEEDAAHKKDIKDLQVTLDSVQKQYDDAKKVLDENKKAEITEIIKKYQDDPDGLAKELSDATGFPVVTTSEEKK